MTSRALNNETEQLMQRFLRTRQKQQLRQLCHLWFKHVFIYLVCNNRLIRGLGRFSLISVRNNLSCCGQVYQVPGEAARSEHFESTPHRTQSGGSHHVLRCQEPHRSQKAHRYLT